MKTSENFAKATKGFAKNVEKPREHIEKFRRENVENLTKTLKKIQKFYKNFGEGLFSMIEFIFRSLINPLSTICGENKRQNQNQNWRPSKSNPWTIS